jgi:hypothetical protein
MLDEFNATSPVMLDLFGLQSYEVTHQDTVQFVKQDLAFVPILDTATVTSLDASPTVDVFGTLAKMVLNSSAPSDKMTVHATFKDGSPAVLSRRAGGPSAGRAILCGFHPSLSYFHKAIPPLPAQRGSTDENFNHFCPADFDLDAKSLIALGTDALGPPPTMASDPLVETGVITAPGKGSLIPLMQVLNQSASSCLWCMGLLRLGWLPIALATEVHRPLTGLSLIIFVSQ